MKKKATFKIYLAFAWIIYVAFMYYHHNLDYYIYQLSKWLPILNNIFK